MRTSEKILTILSILAGVPNVLVAVSDLSGLLPRIQFSATSLEIRVLLLILLELCLAYGFGWCFGLAARFRILGSVVLFFVLGAVSAFVSLFNLEIILLDTQVQLLNDPKIFGALLIYIAMFAFGAFAISQHVQALFIPRREITMASRTETRSLREINFGLWNNPITVRNVAVLLQGFLFGIVFLSAFFR